VILAALSALAVVEGEGRKKKALSPSFHQSRCTTLRYPLFLLFFFHLYLHRKGGERGRTRPCRFFFFLGYLTTRTCTSRNWGRKKRGEENAGAWHYTFILENLTPISIHRSFLVRRDGGGERRGRGVGMWVRLNSLSFLFPPRLAMERGGGRKKRKKRGNFHFEHLSPNCNRLQPREKKKEG